ALTGLVPLSLPHALEIKGTLSTTVHMVGLCGNLSQRPRAITSKKIVHPCVGTDREVIRPPPTYLIPIPLRLGVVRRPRVSLVQFFVVVEVFALAFLGRAVRVPPLIAVVDNLGPRGR